ncbi:MAG: T9SS type A sorting domain-containing protein [Bacteroidota bacterium]|nr:T9SS type A sorting domain-containing protein [Bacteroidota bacterium]
MAIIGMNNLIKFKLRKLAFIPLCIALSLLLSSWGNTGHKKINEHAPASLPSQMSFLKASWTITLAEHASDADYRKSWDPSESKKHFLNIDNYLEFNQTGFIPQNYDSLVSSYGYSFVSANGILPWAAVTAYDSLQNCFQRKDFTKAALFAADLGHYIADGHQPLHITRNYNGQYSGNTGVHSRYETHLIDRFDDQIVYPDDNAWYVTDVTAFIFSRIYYSYDRLDTLLKADADAKAATGSTSSDAYYNAFWGESKDFTIRLFKDASLSLACLIYTAWVNAGMPQSTDDIIGNQGNFGEMLFAGYPNPFSDVTTIPVEIRYPKTPIELSIYDVMGVKRVILLNKTLDPGTYNIKWNATEFPRGSYFSVLRSGNYITAKKLILIP